MEIIFEDQHIQLWFEDEILHAHYKSDAIITLSVAKEILKNRLELQKGKTFPAIVTLSHDLRIFKPQAWRFFSEDGYEGLSKIAVVTNSDMKRSLANMYFVLNPPAKPTRLFTNNTNAKQWILNG